MELGIMIKFEDKEMILTESEAIMLYNKLSELFGKEYTYPIYPAQPINPTYTVGSINVPFMREVESFSKEEMCGIRKELESSTTTCGVNETQWVNLDNIKFDKGIFNHIMMSK